MSTYVVKAPIMPTPCPHSDPSHQVSFKATAPDSEVQSARDNIQSSGGVIKHEYSLIKGFSFEVPENTGIVSTLGSNEHVETVEPDTTVTTQQ